MYPKFRGVKSPTSLSFPPSDAHVCVANRIGRVLGPEPDLAVGQRVSWPPGPIWWLNWPAFRSKCNF